MSIKNPTKQRLALLGRRIKRIVRWDYFTLIRQALAFFQAMGFVPLEGEPPEEPEKLWLAYHLRPWDPAAPKPTKPYLVEAADYEAAREKAAALVDVSGLE